MKNVCVFCGSHLGNNPEFATAVEELGEKLGSHNKTLIYGGGRIGLMGLLADSALSTGGQVIGVIPEFLRKKEVGHQGISQLIEVETMHERKAKMADLADVFLVLPGGFGTLDETFEIITWRQLNLHEKPVVFFNIKNYFDDLFNFLNKATQSGYIAADDLKMFHVVNSTEELIKLLTTS